MRLDFFSPTGLPLTFIFCQQFEYSNSHPPACMIPGSWKCTDSSSCCSWCLHNFVSRWHKLSCSRVWGGRRAAHSGKMKPNWSVVCATLFKEVFFLLCNVCIDACLFFWWGNIALIFAVCHIVLCTPMKWVVCVQLRSPGNIFPASTLS